MFCRSIDFISFLKLLNVCKLFILSGNLLYNKIDTILVTNITHNISLGLSSAKLLRCRRENFGTKLRGQSESLWRYCMCADCTWISWLMTAKNRHTEQASVYEGKELISKYWLTNWETVLYYTCYISGNIQTDCLYTEGLL